ncbi:MAG: hypothetical protein U1A23_01090 [Candidatus Sungbacteria bacterium]|nr:hypothetical protein [bacterium]MDZ4285504.1 hypothetical protein [Candidatus Sungbacteria bacterium]
MDKKKLILFGIAAAVLVTAGIGFLYWPQKEAEAPKKEEGTVETAKNISESVPEIQTNPGEKVPEINPLDRANPFKYTNPLR